MNGFAPNNSASTSSHHFHGDFPQQHSSQPLFANGPLQTHLHQHQQPQPVHNSQHQWQQHQVSPNAPVPQMNAQQQAVMSQAWGNQIPIPQQFPNMNMLPMGSFNMPFLSQQIIQEAFAMSAPVEASDEPTLLKKLLASRKMGQGYKDALNSLHGTNGHSASLWKDYYLDHKDRIDSWISMCIQKEKEKEQSRTPISASPQPPMENKDIRRVSVATIKKPSPASFKREPSPQASSSRVSLTAPAGRPAIKKSRKSETPVPKEPMPAAGRRNTMNSLSAPSPVFGARLPAPNADIRIPEPPSRSPSPPTNIIPHVRGNKYTKEDREFFIKFIGWRLKRDSSLNRQDLCELLAKKAPHHTAQSWASHWSNNHDLPDKILAAAKGDDYPSGESSSEEEEALVKRRPKYKDPSTTEDENSDSDSEESDSDDSKPVRHYSEKEMGTSGTPFNDADQFIAAKYIANFPHWETTISKDRWDPFHAKYPQRSAKSWAEYYRRCQGPLLKLAKSIKREGNGPRPLFDSQCARPTRSLPKRKLDSDPSDTTTPKRGKREAD
ncbi:hypothetical protein NLJ89_g1102 [Agrocybe chaxingu]|uniref:Uncharacterized protein n=1 Tax=Agrocybe chaxingu TaxID=84603 RepID=A0A9W8N0K9_9AGAR|nr:hypothetical protein NLJ89_g1102 [Agrocybe chaxingu]